MINPDRLIATLRNLEIFVNDCHDLQPKISKLPEFKYVLDLMSVAVTNSYVETVGEHADSLHRVIKKVTPDRIVNAYTNLVKARGPPFRTRELNRHLGL